MEREALGRVLSVHGLHSEAFWGSLIHEASWWAALLSLYGRLWTGWLKISVANDGMCSSIMYNMQSNDTRWEPVVTSRLCSSKA